MIQCTITNFFWDIVLSDSFTLAQLLKAIGKCKFEVIYNKTFKLFICLLAYLFKSNNHNYISYKDIKLHWISFLN